MTCHDQIARAFTTSARPELKNSLCCRQQFTIINRHSAERRRLAFWERHKHTGWRSKWLWVGGGSKTRHQHPLNKIDPESRHRARAPICLSV